jgi:hypothetical protein
VYVCVRCTCDHSRSLSCFNAHGKGSMPSPQTTPSTHIIAAVQMFFVETQRRLNNEYEAHDDVAFVNDPRDINYEPPAASTSKTRPKQKKTASSGRSDILTERKFVVFESCLLQLFLICRACFSAGCSAAVRAVIGIMVIRQKCDLCGETTSWNSQPYIRDIPVGNLLCHLQYCLLALCHVRHFVCLRL